MNPKALFYFISFALILSSSICFGQRRKKEVTQYQSIPMANVEEAFPVAAMILSDTYKVNVTRFDWGQKEMLSGFYQYQKFLGPHRFKFLITIDSDNMLNVEAKEVQTTTTDGWIDYVVEKRERELVATFAEELREALKRPDLITTAQERFYTDLSINALFFLTATEVAGDRWFENYIKDRRVSWKLSFADLAENNNPSYEYAYVENYNLAVEFISGDKTHFTIRKYTDSDKNVLARKGSPVIVEGNCLRLDYNNSFNITLVD